MALVNGGLPSLYEQEQIPKNIFFSETTCQTLKEFHRNVP